MNKSLKEIYIFFKEVLLPKGKTSLWPNVCSLQCTQHTSSSPRLQDSLLRYFANYQRNNDWVLFPKITF